MTSVIEYQLINNSLFVNCILPSSILSLISYHRSSLFSFHRNYPPLPLAIYYPSCRITLSPAITLSTCRLWSHTFNCYPLLFTSIFPWTQLLSLLDCSLLSSLSLVYSLPHLSISVTTCPPNVIPNIHTCSCMTRWSTARMRNGWGDGSAP